VEYNNDREGVIMDILIYDEEYEKNHHDYIKPLTDNIKNLHATILDDLNNAQNIFTNNKFEYVIVDFTNSDGKNFLNFVLQQNPEQRVITLSYELVSSKENCSDCLQQFKKRRLIKPVEAIDIYKTIKNFDEMECKYYNHFSNPHILVNDLVSRYDYFDFDEQEQTIEKSNKENDYCIKEYIDLVDKLKKYEIKHEIIGEFQIKITH